MFQIKKGQKVRFDPMAHMDGMCADTLKGEEVTGTIVMVNYKHRWFSVEYGDPKARTSFKFVDIGELVKFIG